MVVKSVKKPATKVVSKPTVTVETKKISSGETCCSTPCCRISKHCILIGLLVINLVLTVFVLVNQTKVEVLRSGGQENYKLIKQIYKTEWYKLQQKQQLEQALQMLSQPQEQAPVDTAAVQQAVEPTQEQAQ